MEETWKTLYNDSRYEVSNLGQIRNKKSNKILKQKDYRHGYKGITLYNKGKFKTHQLHRLIMLTFKQDEYFEGALVNHKNNIKYDNRLENLEWCTQKENIQHMIKQGRNNTPKGERSGKTIFKNEDILEMRRLYNSGITIKEINKNYSVTYACIQRIVNNKRWSHI